MNGAVAVIRLSSLGDILLTSPLLINLRLARPNNKIVLVTRERFRSAADLLSVDRLIAIPEPVAISAIWTTSSLLEENGVSELIDLQGNWRSWLLRSWLGPSKSSVYAKNRFERTSMIGKSENRLSPLHVIDQYQAALHAFDVHIHARHPVHFLPDIHRLAGLRKSQIVISPGASHHPKRWPISSFIELARILRNETHASIIWAATSEEAAHFRGNSEVVQFDQVFVDEPLDHLARIIAESSLTIANDSGILHLSSAVRTPTLGIFGPTHPALGFAPTGFYDQIAQVDLFCRPCSLHGKRPCWREEQFCFTTLTPKMVARQAGAMYAAQLKRRPVLILDRDGTIIVNRHYAHDPDQIEFLPSAIELITSARNAGIAVLLVSNQSGVARGFFSFEDAQKMNAALVEKLREAGAEIDASLFCPHHRTAGEPSPYRTPCLCRKPSAGMVHDVAQGLSLDLGRCMVVGDSLDDLGLGLVLGCRRVLVTTGHGEQTRREIAGIAAFQDVEIIDSLAELVREL